MPRKEVKYKYNKGNIVYCRPWMITGTGMEVCRCRVTQRDFIGGKQKTPYYTLQETESGMFHFVIYEKEISRRKERLIKEAMIEMQKQYYPALDGLNYYILKIQTLR